MDSISIIVTALAAGAASSATADVDKQVIHDAYQGLKALIQRKFGADSQLSSAVGSLDSRPESQGRRAVIAVSSDTIGG